MRKKVALTVAYFPGDLGTVTRNHLTLRHTDVDSLNNSVPCQTRGFEARVMTSLGLSIGILILLIDKRRHILVLQVRRE